MAPSLAASPSATHTATQGEPASKTTVHLQIVECETRVATHLVWLSAYISTCKDAFKYRLVVPCDQVHSIC